jgi:hypothetical protein
MRETGLGCKARLGLHQRLLPLHQAELPPQRRVLARGVIDPIKSPEQQGAAIAQETILVGRQKSRPQHGAQRPASKKQTAAPELGLERGLALARHFVVQ